jgi:D-glycero-alpha-D-manno-heptose-7-phosphate kinase
MIFRSKAPLRIGLAGGGTDVSPFCDIYGGAVLNATIDMYAYCSIEPNNSHVVEFYAADRDEYVVLDLDEEQGKYDILPLHVNLYRRIKNLFFNGCMSGFKLTTYSDAPAGSGLGSSSTMMVAMIKAYQEWSKYYFLDYDIAQLAYQVERVDCGFSGGKQDQYATVFGGLNFIEFRKDVTVVNPLRISPAIKNELENMLIMYYTGKSRFSSDIIDAQVEGAKKSKGETLDALQKIKQSAYQMKDSVLRGNFEEVCTTLNTGWAAKKQSCNSVTSQLIDSVYDFVMSNGGKAAKISGAGGGGYMMILCNPTYRSQLLKKLNSLGGVATTVSFTNEGAVSWTVP